MIKLAIGLLVGGAGIWLVVSTAGGVGDAIDAVRRMRGGFVVLAVAMAALRLGLYGLQLTWLGRRSGLLGAAAIDLILVIALGHLALHDSWPFMIAAFVVLLALAGTAVLARRPSSAQRAATLLNAIHIPRRQPPSGGDRLLEADAWHLRRWPSSAHREIGFGWLWSQGWLSSPTRQPCGQLVTRPVST